MRVLFFYVSDTERTLVEKLASLRATSKQHSVSSGGISSYSFFLVESPKSLFDKRKTFSQIIISHNRRKKIQSESMSKTVAFSKV